jgi:hypothetical protein
MHPRLLCIFLDELNEQCASARLALEETERAIARALGPGVQADAFPVESLRRIWFNLQAFLGFAANVSKLLWPVRAKSKLRGEELRALLKVDDTSPLRSRDARNDLEHFDERMDDWAAGAAPHFAAVDRNIVTGPNPQILRNTFALRNLDVRSMTFTFMGVDHKLRALETAIKDLQLKIAEAKKSVR